jgi:hypothetical protein
MMSAQAPQRLQLRVAQFRFIARLETQTAPRSVALLTRMLPIERSVLHARWSGEAGWVPLGSGLELAAENATAYPQPGQLLLYAGTQSEAELLIPYGACAFASRAGRLAGNPVAMIEGDLSPLRALGEMLLWKGAQTIELELL